MNIIKLAALRKFPTYVPPRKDLCTEHFQAGFGSYKFVDSASVDSVHESRKLNLYDEKTLEKKHWNSENILYLAGEGGEGGQPDPRKKIVSVGLFSTFRHPLGNCAFNGLLEGSSVDG